MVVMPQLAGLNRQQARAIIEASGLRFGGESSATTSNQSLDNITSSQSIAAGTLVDYESVVDIVFSTYVAPVVTLINTVSGSCYISGGYWTSTTCSGTTLIITESYSRERQVTYFYSDGSSSIQYQGCSPSVSSQSIAFSTTCGYVPPAPTCVANCGSYDWGPCQGGVQIGERNCTRANCSVVAETTTRSCCSSGCGSYTWGTCSGGTQTGTRTCTRSDCSRYTDTSSRCCAATVTGGWSSCFRGTQERVITEYSSSCTSTSRVQTRSCTSGGGGGGSLIAV